MIQIFYALLLVHVFGLAQGSVCVPLNNCEKLWNLLKEPLTLKSITTLKQAQCGYEGVHPKVWCASSCQTPDGQFGTCIPIKECEPFLQLVKSSNGLSMDVISYLQKSQCKEQDYNLPITICCPKGQNSLIIKQPRITTEPPAVTPLPLINAASDTPEQNPPSFLPKPEQGQCGIQEINKIIGGKVTEMDEFPWTALLEYYSRGRVNNACAGTLISNKYVVTAAHCTDSNAVRVVGKLINVILGEFDKRTPRDCINYLGVEDCADPPLKVPVEEVIIHDQWYTVPKAQINHDIALVRLAESVRFTDFIKPICLPSSTLKIAEKKNLVVAGWGQTEYGVPSFVKLKTTIPLANRNSCLKKYKSDRGLDVGDGEICVGGEEGKDSCSGDSGGPLMYAMNNNGAGVWFLVGVVSFGFNQPCGIKDYPALYTYLPKYVNWIYNTVEP